ncbi:MAG TPA: hypothetical protein VJL59_14685 [Anaerolineales bacterium]|nr:hypothetical protein [Anaerolineales bacterium]
MSDTLSLLSLALTLRPVEAVAAGTGRVPHVGRTRWRSTPSGRPTPRW